MQIIPEQWKQYDENYWVSDQGRVKRVFKNGRVTYLIPQKRRKEEKTYRVKIYSKYVSLNRLVWETFNGKIPDGYVIVHRNGCYTMNELYNLKLIKKSDACRISGIAQRKKVINLDTGIVYPSTRAAAKYLNMSKTNVSYYCNNVVANPIYNLEYYDDDKNYKRTLRFIRY